MDFVCWWKCWSLWLFWWFILDVPVNEAQVIIYIKSIKGVKMPEEIEVSILHKLCVYVYIILFLLRGLQLFKWAHNKTEFTQLTIVAPSLSHLEDWCNIKFQRNLCAVLVASKVLKLNQSIYSGHLTLSIWLIILSTKWPQ